MEYIVLIVLLAGFALIYFKGDNKNLTNNKKQELTHLETKNQTQINKIIELEKINSTLIERNNSLEKTLEENLINEDNEKKRLTQEFENLSNKILNENSDKFQKQNKKEIDTLLKPLNEKIKEFQEKVESTNKEDIQRNSSLITQIENLQRLNSQLSSDAINLTNALKGESKTQGDWG